MTRLLMLVGVAVVAAAMYVAASSASQSTKGVVTVKEFNALKKTVTTDGKKIKALDNLAGLEVTLISDCVQNAVPIDQFGNPTGTPVPEGYHYQLPVSGAPTEILTTGLDVTDPTTDTGALFITGGDQSCGTLVNGSGLRHAAAKAGFQLPHIAAHHWTFASHQK